MRCDLHHVYVLRLIRKMYKAVLAVQKLNLSTSLVTSFYLIIIINLHTRLEWKWLMLLNSTPIPCKLLFYFLECEGTGWLSQYTFIFKFFRKTWLRHELTWNILIETKTTCAVNLLLPDDILKFIYLAKVYLLASLNVGCCRYWPI
jgi:hypothetical protein